jgi:hypothetical protein
MRIAKWALVGSFVAAAVWTSSVAFTQDKPDADGMKRWMDSCKSGPHHKDLARFVGSWDTETTITGMGGPPIKEKGTAECRWLVEGKWIVTDSKGVVMNMPLASHKVMGYDNFKKKYVVSHTDSLQTCLLTGEGLFAPSGALIVYGKMDEPMTGECDKTVKWVWRFDGPDRITLEIHDMDIGEANTMVFDIVYTRRK